MRTPHYIKPNKRSELPSEAIWFDTESIQVKIKPCGVKHVLDFGWAVYCRRTRDYKWTSGEWFRITSAKDFISWLIVQHRKKTTLYLFCHNTNFDVPVLDLFRLMGETEYTLESAIIDAPPTICTWQGPHGKIILLDTLNFWRQSLKAIGEWVSLPKLDMPDNMRDTQLADTYCRRDCAIIRKACIDWWRTLGVEDMGGFARTIAGQSMRTWRHKYMHHQVLIDADEQALLLARDGYYGGRNECFFIGAISRVQHILDVNALYPHVMREHDYPTHLIGHQDSTTIGELQHWLDNHAVMARVYIMNGDGQLPCRRNGRLLFPRGSFWTVLSTPELKYAIERDLIATISECSVYRQAPIFYDYVSDLHPKLRQARAAGHAVSAKMFKMLLTNLYGKFGQNGVVYESAGHTDDLSACAWIDLDMETGQQTRYRQLGGLVQCQVREQESRESHPAIAAHVTAYGRSVLRAGMQLAGRGHYTYCDTDSLMVDLTGLRAMHQVIHPSELGLWKDQDIAHSAHIWGPKDYRFGLDRKIKGVREKAIWMGPRKVLQDQWSGLRGLIAAGRLDTPTTKPITKQLGRTYHKGTVLDSGWIEPPVLAETLNDDVLTRRLPRI